MARLSSVSCAPQQGRLGPQSSPRLGEDGATNARVQILNQSGPAVQNSLDALRASGMSMDQALRQYEGSLQSQSVMLATDHIFMVIAVILLLAAGVCVDRSPTVARRGPGRRADTNLSLP